MAPEEKQTPSPGALVAAVVRGSFAEVQALIAAGASVNDASDLTGMTALMEAINQGETDIALYLMAQGAALEAASNLGRTALMFAADTSHEDSGYTLLAALLAHGVNIDAMDDDGNTALSNASWRGHARAVRLLLESGADVNAQSTDGGWTALMGAAENTYGDVVELLLAHKARLDLVNEDGDTALDLALAQLDVALWEDPDVPLTDAARDDLEQQERAPKEWIVEQLRNVDRRAAAESFAAAAAKESRAQHAVAAQKQQLLRVHAPVVKLQGPL